MELFRVEDLTFSYPQADKPALNQVNLAVSQGEFVLICGTSGSGKTTLLRHFKTVLAPFGPRTGMVRFLGTPLDSVPQRDQAAKIGFVMQSPDEQMVTDKVWHELSFGLENLGCDPITMRARVAEMASYFGIQDWFHRETAELSGGQRQLLNMASIMAMQPEVLLLDEPTSQLDPIAASDFLNTLKKINRELGTTIIITEHRTEEIFPAADRVIVMEKGRVIADDQPGKVCRILHDAGNAMFAAVPAAAKIYYETNQTGHCPLTVREGRRWLQDTFTQAPEYISLPETDRHWKERKPALEVREGWFRYTKNGPDILRGLDFTVPQGALYAIVGGNGTGKSTSLKAISGICRLYRGSVSLFGKKLSSYKKDDVFRNCLTMLPQDPKSLFVCRTVLEDLKEMSSDEKRIEEAAALCDVAHLLSSHPCDLSGGEVQRAALAKVLLTNPRLLLLDEPTKSIDNFFKKKFAQLLRHLCDAGITVVMVSHDVEFCAEYADLVSMFFDGQIITTDTPHRFFGANSFYTTSASRMSRCVFQNAVTAADVAELLRKNGRCAD